MIKKFLILLGIILFLVWFVPTTSRFPVQDLAPEDLVKVQELFAKNKLDLDNFYPTRVISSEYGNFHVRGHQVFKGVTVYQDLIFHFDDNGDYESISGYPAANISFSNNPQITLPDTFGYQYFRPIPFTPKPFIPSYIASLRSRFLMGFPYFFFPQHASLAIYDRHSGESYMSQDWTLVWEIVPFKFGNYPQVLIDAFSGKVLYYDNGIRTGTY